MNFSLETGASAITVFIQGLISFFSPCVLPLIPLYIGYLSGGTNTKDENGQLHFKRSKIMTNTLFFVFGISFAFFLLGFGFTAVGKFFGNYQTLLTRIGGIVVILFGLYQLGIFGNSTSANTLLGREHRFLFRPSTLAMNPFTALILGFTFSFAWTPCVGPVLASVLIMAASSASSFTGFLLIGIYTLGFVLPFMAVGLFTGTLLSFFKKHVKIVKYTVKMGGILMLLIGFMMFTGWMNLFSSYLSGGSTTINSTADADETTSAGSDETPAADTGESPAADIITAPDFTLVDQFGNTHTLSDYKGKTVFLNFWATWCPPCKAEMPDIQALYEEYGENSEDVIILGIASPNVGREGSTEDIKAFLSENNYTYPVVMDEDGMMAYAYGISSLPTTYMIDSNGNLFGRVSGQLTKDIMKNIITQTKDGTAPAQSK